jgi:hypothetical protein
MSARTTVGLLRRVASAGFQPASASVGEPNAVRSSIPKAQRRIKSVQTLLERTHMESVRRYAAICVARSYVHKSQWCSTGVRLPFSSSDSSQRQGAFVVDTILWQYKDTFGWQVTCSYDDVTQLARPDSCDADCATGAFTGMHRAGPATARLYFLF